MGEEERAATVDGSSGVVKGGAGTVQPQVLRVEFLYTRTPVEGCDLIPYVVVKTPEGEVKSAEGLESRSRGAFSVQYRWLRCSPRYMCSTPGCKQPASVQFTPILRQHSAGGAEAGGGGGGGGGAVKDDNVRASLFCSRSCLCESWSRLRRQQNAEFANRAADRAPPAGASSAAAADEADLLLLGATPRSPLHTPLDNPIDAKEVGWIRNFAPTRKEIDHVLRLVCRYALRMPNGEVSVGPPVSAESEPVEAMPPAPPRREMTNVFTREVFATQPRWMPPGGSFRVLTYNCLAEIYANARQFPYCPSWALAWTYRRRNLLRELKTYEADILCLQEVQADHFEDHFQPCLAQMGYEGRFKSKTREAMGRRGKVDGCATFWSKSRFALLEQYEVEFNTVAHGRGVANARGLKMLMKGNVALITVLSMLDGSGALLMVVNTHIYWDPEQTEVKIFQVDALLQEVDAVLERLGAQVPVVFAGDFNSRPDSAVYDLLAHGELNPAAYAELADDRYDILASCRLEQNLALRSAYCALGHEPAFTNYTRDFVGTLDYIWYTSAMMLCFGVLNVPSYEQLLADGAEAVPSPRWSSDHVALMADFQLVAMAHPPLM